MKNSRRLIMRTATILALSSISVVCGADRRDRRTPFEPTKTVVYKTVGDVSLSLHVFEPKGHKSSDERPAIVFFFGGGWVGGSPGQFYPHCHYLASRGMVACAAEYRVNKRHGTSPFECVKDGKSAVRWLRANADELGIDPDRIAAGGGSAGGHVAACTGVIEGLDEEGEDTTVSSRPVAMALFNPVIDTGPKGYGYNRLKDRYREISPVDHVKKGVPPTIIFHGTADTTVPCENVQRFRDNMAAAGNRCQLDEFEDAGHGFFNYGRGGGTAYIKTVRAMDEFLAELGFLPGEPTIAEP
jgi:acetyl esterase/lipase